MANRVLRNYTNSEKINALSYEAEVLFIRLMMHADDFGSFYANIKLIKSNCFPLRTDTITDADIAGWMDELQASGLIVIYLADGKQYLRILQFGQRLRNMRNVFPKPSDSTLQPVAANGSELLTPNAANGSKSPPETKRNETETNQKRNESETESETETKGEKIFFNEKFLVPEMLKEWKKYFPKYFEKKEYDWPALRGIAEVIAEKQAIDCDVGIMPHFKRLAEYVSKDNFYRDYSLMQVNKHIQNIVNKANNDATKHTNGNGKSFREQVNQAFAERYPRGAQ